MHILYFRSLWLIVCYFQYTPTTEIYTNWPSLSLHDALPIWLEAKNPEGFAIGPDVPVIDAVRLMAEKDIGAVLVMQGGRLAGILSERDYARKVVLQLGREHV